MSQAQVSLRPMALSGMLGGVVTLLVLSGVPGVVDPLLAVVYEFFFGVGAPTFLIEVSSFLGYLGVASGVVKFYGNRDLADTFNTTGQIRTLGPEDTGIFVVYLAVGLVGLWVVGQPVTPTTVLQVGVLVVMAMAFASIPWVLWNHIDLPAQTRDPVVKTGVLSGYVVIGVLITVAGVVATRVVQLGV